jgi:hypothetical protein
VMYLYLDRFRFWMKGKRREHAKHGGSQLNPDPSGP